MLSAHFSKVLSMRMPRPVPASSKHCSNFITDFLKRNWSNRLVRALRIVNIDDFIRKFYKNSILFIRFGNMVFLKLFIRFGNLVMKTI